ncbi:MAG TPA: hypothetical protein VK765_06920, partial [Solirubrobacteraceae bacterium]|nr:hypothetical protein [Solirubrobacteraceae bacterium]
MLRGVLGRASRRTIVALVMLAFAGGCTVAPAGASASVSAENAATTHAYLVAQYKLARVQLHEAAAVRRAETAAAAQIARECRGALSGMPQPSFDPFAAPTPRVRGENARLNHQE